MAQVNVSPAVTLDQHFLDKFQKTLQEILMCFETMAG